MVVVVASMAEADLPGVPIAYICTYLSEQERQMLFPSERLSYVLDIEG